MVNHFKKHIFELQKEHLLPKQNYFSSARFFTPYANPGEFYTTLRQALLLPEYNALMACAFTLTSLGHVLFFLDSLSSGSGNNPQKELFHSTIAMRLGLGLALMIPIQALTYNTELMTRLVCSWFFSRETIASDFNQEDEETQQDAWHKANLEHRLFTAQNDAMRPYDNLTDGILGVLSPFTHSLEGLFYSLLYAGRACSYAMSCLNNVLIARFMHAMQDAYQSGVYGSLAFKAACLIPIQAGIDIVVNLARLTTTDYNSPASASSGCSGGGPQLLD